MSNKMALYMMDQKVLSKPFTLVVVPVLLWRDNTAEFSIHVTPSRDTIYWIFKEFQDTGGV
jgi:hypothetical protein